MPRSDLHPHWYGRLLLFWLFTGLPVLVLSNFHNPNFFQVVPGPPPVAEGAYPLLAWLTVVIIIWHPVLLLPVKLWSARRQRRGD